MEVLAVSHVHSSWSYDGTWPIDALASAFGQRGYRVVMMTEHDRGFTADRFAEYRRACADATTSRVHVLPGLEYSDAANRVHVLVWGPVPFLGERLPTDEVLEAVGHYGGVAVLAHPARRAAWECVAREWVPRLLGIETWNRKYDGWAPSEVAGALMNGAAHVPFVGLDFHTRRQFFPLAMEIEVDSRVDEDALVGALQHRRCAARAFGMPLDAKRLQGRVPLLRAAERGRRRLARLKHYSKARVSR